MRFCLLLLSMFQDQWLILVSKARFCIILQSLHIHIGISYIFSTKDLPFFVNSNEWHLDTSTATGGRSKVLHFVIHVPSAKECPLKLQLANGKISMTNGFISPIWGGIIVWNPLQMHHLSRHKISSEVHLSTKQVMRNVAFVQYLSSLTLE